MRGVEVLWFDATVTQEDTMRLVTYDQIAKELQVSRATIERMVAAGVLPKPIKLGPGKGSSARFDLTAVEKKLGVDRDV